MLNTKIIIVAGYSRGGTNILWNILQSHPKICAPRHETGAILSYSRHLKFGRFYARIKKFDFSESFLIKKLVDYQLYRYKMETLTNQNNKYKSEYKLYSKDEVSKAALCLKSVDDDIFLTDDLINFYPDLYIICLTRNGYALANGHKRRNRSIEKTAKLYCRIGQKMDELSKKHHKMTTIKFEDVLNHPFVVSEKLYQFISVKPEKIYKLRFKSKKILRQNSTHEVNHGEEDQKYWFDKEQARQFLDPKINNKQIVNLSRPEIDTFNSIAAEQLKSFGYDMI